MRFKSQRWKSVISWLLIIAMLGGYGNTALAAGVGSFGNESIENTQEEAGAGSEAGTETGSGTGAGTESGSGSDTESGSGLETEGSTMPGEDTGTTGPGTEEEKPSENETPGEEDTEPSQEEEEASGELVSDETDAELAVSQQEKVHKTYWESPNFANLVVFVDFADTNHDHSEGTIYAGCYKKSSEATFRYFNGDSLYKKGMRQYLYNISYGQLRVENVFPQYDAATEKITSYTLPKNGAYYKEHEAEMIQTIIQKLQANGELPQGISMDLWKNDGILDNLTVVVPCDNGNKTTLFVGHKSDYAGSEQIGGKLVRSYNIVTEEGIYFNLLKHGLIIHEFLHTMGYPDLYRSVKDVEAGKNIPVSLWDIMATENHRVQYPLAYLRSAITGWFEIPTLTESKEGLSLYAASRTTEATKDQQALILKTDYSDNEFFVVEYRKQGQGNVQDPDKGDYEEQIPGSGLIVYRVNAEYKTNITGPPDFIYVFRPGDKFGSHGHEEAGGDIFKSFLSQESGRTSYGSSNPKDSLAEGAITYADGTNSGIVISNVGKADGDQITFDIEFHGQGEEAWKTVAREEANAGTSEAAYCMSSDGKLYALLTKNYATALYECKDGGFVKVADVPSGGRYKLTEYQGMLYIAYFDSENSVQLARWNGSTWQGLYTVPREANELCLTSDVQGVYLAYLYTDKDDWKKTQIFAVKHTLDRIFELGSQVCISDKGAANPSIAAENGNVVVAYREGSNSDQLGVKQYNASLNAWEDVGNQDFKASRNVIKVKNNRLYVMTYATSWVSGTGRSEARVYTCDLAGERTWKQVGEGIYTDVSVADMDLCLVGGSGTPYLVYTSSKEPVEIVVKRLRNNQWVNLGASVANGGSNNLHVFAYEGQIYVAYQNAANRNAFVRSHSWELEEEETPPYEGTVREDENGKWLLITERDSEGEISEEELLAIFQKHAAQAPFDGISIVDTDEKGTFSRKLKQTVINEAASLLKDDGELVFGFWESGSQKLTQWHLQAPYEARRDYDGTVTAAREDAVWSLSLSDTGFPADNVWVSYGEPGLASYQNAEKIYYYTKEEDGEERLVCEGAYRHTPAEESAFGELHALHLYEVNHLKAGTAYTAETSRKDWRLEYGYTIDENGEEIGGTVVYYGTEEELIAALGSKSIPNGANIRIESVGEEQPGIIRADLLKLCAQKTWDLEYIRRENQTDISYVWNLSKIPANSGDFDLSVALADRDVDLPEEFLERTYLQVKVWGAAAEGMQVSLKIRQEGIGARFGEEKLLSLWQQEDEKLQFLGTAKSDTEEGNWVSFVLRSSEGERTYVLSSQSEYGWQMVPDDEDATKEQAVYIESRSGLRVTGWEIVEGRKCYFNHKGYLIQGPAEVNGVWYLFGDYLKNTWGIRTGLVTEAGEDGTFTAYYANAAGELQKGWQKIGEVWHYFNENPDSRTYTYGQELPSVQEGYWVTMQPGSGSLEGRRYYFKNNKTLLKNWQTVEGKRYFFMPEGYAYRGWYPNSTDKNVYYLNELGEMQTGYTIAAPEEEGGEAKSYFFHTNGVRQYGWQRAADESGEYIWHYFNEDPASETYAYGQEIVSEPQGDGWYEMEGATYYFAKNTRLATGWQTIDGNRYYFNKQGQMAVGTEKIGSAYYHFCEEAEKKGVLGTGLFEDGGFTYYANGSGALQRGWQKIDGNWRFFNHDTGAEEIGSVTTNYWAVVSAEEGKPGKISYFINGTKIATGWQTIEGRRYYFNGDGILQTGFFTVGKNTYYGREAQELEEYPGEVLTGEQRIGDENYYFGSNYVMYTGWQKIDNVWRYFSAEGTSPELGQEKSYDRSANPEIEDTWYWYTVEGSRYCFRSNTTLLKGWQTINGERYYLDPATGAAVTGEKGGFQSLKIGNYVYCFDEKGVMQKDAVVEGFGYNAKGYRVSGWQKLNNEWHYFDNTNAKDPETWKEVPQAESGRGSYWVTLDFGGERGEETYYFRNNSSMVKNWQNIDGQRYYFDPKTGVLRTGDADGLYYIGANAYYLGTDGALRYGWIGEKTYYANNSGVLQSGWQKIDNLWYYFSREDRKRDVKAQVGADYFATAHEGETENTYYFVNGTTLAKGWQTIGGIRYYFDTSTNVMKTGLFQVGKAWYCFREDHTPQTGWWKRPETGKYYYFNASGQAVTGWQTIKAADGTSNRYYFDADGIMQTQRVKIGKIWYFFGPDGKMRTGFVKYCDTTYYFKSNGQMLTGWQTIEGQRYYFDGEGSLQTGFVTVGKATYYFDTKKAALGQMLKGEQKIGTSTYYFNNSGVLQYGWQKLDYVWRFFDLATGAECPVTKGADDWRTIHLSETETARSFINNGASLLKGWQTIGGKRYYFDPNGLLWTQEKGWLTVGKNQFYFRADGSVHQGFLELAGENGNTDTYYLNANGQMLKGWQTVKEGTVSSKYYLDPVSGIAWTGHRQIGKNWYYFDPADHGKMAVGYIQDAEKNGYDYNTSGVRQTGWQKIDGEWKYFTPESGKECQVSVGEDYWATITLGEERTERAYLKGGTKVLTGWQTINEKRYYFDSNGFQWTADKGWLTIGKNQFYFDESKNHSVYQGFLELEGKTYYLNASGQALKGWQTITFEGVKGKYYLDPADGAVFMGHRQIGKNWYYFDPADHGKMAVGYIQDADQDWYYYNSSGVLLTGWQKPGKETDYHYFDPAGNGDGTHVGAERKVEKDVQTFEVKNKTYNYHWYTIQDGDCTVNGTKYCFNNNSSMLKNRQSIDGKYYWFHSSTGVLYTGYFAIGNDRYRAYDGSEKDHCADHRAGEVYTGFGPAAPGSRDTGYYDSYGKRVTGWQTIKDEQGNSAKYYFNANGVRLEGIQWIGKDRYVFRDGSDGAGCGQLVTESKENPSGSVYLDKIGDCYADKNGKLKTGWNRISETTGLNWKYLSKETGGEQTVEILEQAPGAEDLSTDGRYVWYEVTEGGETDIYCISNSTTILKKYQNIDGRRYYFDANSGKLQKGWFLAGTVRCYSSPETGVITAGKQKIEDTAWYYLNGDGKPQTGWQTMKAVDGALTKYYFDENGRMLTGFKKIGKQTYYFLPESAGEQAGVMQTGYVTIADGQNAGAYCFNDKGEMQTGWVSYTDSEKGKVWKYFGADGREIEPTGTPGSVPPAVRGDASSKGENKIDGSYVWYQIGEDWYCIQNNYTLVKGRFVSTGGYIFYLDKTTGALKKGHFQDGRTWYYSDIDQGYIEPSGRLVTEWDADGKHSVKYYYGINGKRVTGWQPVKEREPGGGETENRYYFEPSSGQAVSGLVRIGKQDYYFDTESKALQKSTDQKSTEQKEEGETPVLIQVSRDGEKVLYYTGTNDYLLSGLQNVDGEWYYFDPKTKEGQAAAEAPDDGANGWLTLEDGTRYYLTRGKLQTGWLKLKEQEPDKGVVENRYYFDGNGVLQKGWINIKSDRYYTDESTGKAVTGFRTFADGEVQEGVPAGTTAPSYYFDKGLMKKGWVTLPDSNNSKMKDYYYCNSNGILLKGICWIGNTRYVLDLNTGERAGKESFDSIIGTDRNRYYANDNGTLKTGWQKVKASGKSYYYGTDGQLAKGWQIIGGKTYYFAQNGFPEEDPDGAMQTGYQSALPVPGSSGNSQTAAYYFNSSGVLQTGWFRFTENKQSVWRFFAADGRELPREIRRERSPKGETAKGYLWYRVNGDWYCIQNDKKLLKGFVNLGTWRYYFDNATGALVKGHFSDGKYQYYSDPDGAINRSGCKLEEEINGKKAIFYFDKNGKRVTGWMNLEDGRYYFDPSDGQAVSGLVRIGKQDYYFDTESKVLQKSVAQKGASAVLIQVNQGGRELLYYTGSYEYLLSGWQKVDGSWYYFDAETKQGVQSRIVPDRDGNWVELDGEQYYFDKGKTLAKGWKSLAIDGVTGRYYFDGNGVLQKGWIRIKGSSYYAYETDEVNETPGKAANEELLYFVDGVCQKERPETGAYDTYYFDKNGLMKTGWVTLTDENKKKKSYYFNSNGEMRKGLCWIGNSCYVLNPDTGVRIENDSVQIDGKVYYANGKGILKTGWEKVKIGKNYYSYYYGTDGQQASGWQVIDGKTYYFAQGGIPEDAPDGAMLTGYQPELPVPGAEASAETAAYYFNGSGVMQTGWFLIAVPEGKVWKYFGADGRELQPDAPVNVTPKGQASTNYRWYRVEEAGETEGTTVENWYCIDNRNRLLKGSYKIGDWKYYFDSATGALQKGHFTVGTTPYYSEPDTGAINVNGLFYTEPETGDIYYYDGNGKQVTGWLTIKSGTYAGRYYFNTLTGAAYRGGWYYVDNEYCHFDENGILLQKEMKPSEGLAKFGTFVLEKNQDGKDCIRAEFTVGGWVKSYCGDEDYYLIRVDSYSNKILSIKPLHSISKDEGESEGEILHYEFQAPLPQEFDGDRNLQEVIMSKYSLAVKSSENGYTVISSGAYVSNPEFMATIDTAYYMPSSKKGIQGARAEWVIDAGTKNTLMNLDLKKVVLKGKQEGCVEYVYKGKTYYFDSLTALRATVSRFNQKEKDEWGREREPLQITFAILMSYDSGLTDMIEPSARRAGAAPYYALNTRSQSSQERLEAVFSYLGEVFGQDNCYVSNWVLGNEVNSCNAWNYTGGMDLSSYMKGYANAFRILYHGVKQTRPSSRVFISLDNAWTRAVAGHAGKSVLNSFASRIYSEAPHVNWDLSFHPYSAPLTRTDFWNDTSNTTNSVNSPFISMRNLNYLNQYLASMENQYGREPESIKMILSEQGWTSTGNGGEEGQARALAQAYYIAEFNERVLAFTIRAEKDDPKEVRDGLSMGLRDEKEKYKPAYYVYRYMDTPVAPSKDSSELLISEYNKGNLWLSNSQWKRFEAAQRVMALNWKKLVPGYREEKLNGMPYAFPM